MLHIKIMAPLGMQLDMLQERQPLLNIWVKVQLPHGLVLVLRHLKLQMSILMRVSLLGIQ
ncbi:hypothetical protein HMPREF2572_03085 [Neisseria sp. HMSC064E01]|nr:hypothetical protein HMPREF2572_03085 [Neisseria sp. HMSC064E01]